MPKKLTATQARIKAVVSQFRHARVVFYDGEAVVDVDDSLHHVPYEGFDEPELIEWLGYRTMQRHNRGGWTYQKRQHCDFWQFYPNERLLVTYSEYRTGVFANSACFRVLLNCERPVDVMLPKDTMQQVLPQIIKGTNSNYFTNIPQLKTDTKK